MAYIGASPTARVLQTSDIEDGAVTSAKIANTTITATDMDLSGTYAFTGTVTGAGLSASSEPIAKAWVQFDGTAATVSVDAGYNVSSITDHGSGLYTINFTNAFEDAEYCAVYGNRSPASEFHWIIEDGNTVVRSTTAVRITIAKHDNSTATNSAVVSAAFFR